MNSNEINRIAINRAHIKRINHSAGIFYGIRQRGSNISPASARPGDTKAQMNSNEINRIAINRGHNERINQTMAHNIRQKLQHHLKSNQKPPGRKGSMQPISNAHHAHRFCCGSAGPAL
jgi:hypothetical protein